MQDNTQSTCSECAFFDNRNSFCRRFPPSVIPSGNKYDELTGYKTTFAKTVYPIISMPEVDYCGEFQQAIV